MKALTPDQQRQAKANYFKGQFEQRTDGYFRATFSEKKALDDVAYRCFQNAISRGVSPSEAVSYVFLQGVMMGLESTK